MDEKISRAVKVARRGRVVKARKASRQIGILNDGSQSLFKVFQIACAYGFFKKGSLLEKLPSEKIVSHAAALFCVLRSGSCPRWAFPKTLAVSPLLCHSMPHA